MTLPPLLPAPMTRRTLLRAAAVGTTVTASATLFGGCGTTQDTQPAVLPPASPTGTLVMITRHAEKPATSGPPQGIDVNGNPDPHSLTVRGWTRAGALVQLFAPGLGVSRVGLARPTAVYAAGGISGEGERPRETVTPLAARLGLAVNTRYSKGDEVALAKECANRGGPTLICWQHGEIPAILAAFGQVTPAPPTSWPDNRFDMVWVLTPKSGGWSFTQVPHLLLDGDSADPIG